MKIKNYVQILLIHSKMKLWWFFWVFWILSKPKPSLTLLWTLKNFIRDSWFVWSFFSWKWPTPSLYFFLITLSHMTTMCVRIVIFWFFLNYLCSFELYFDDSLQKMYFQKNVPIQSLYISITMSHKRTNYAGILFL